MQPLVHDLLVHAQAIGYRIGIGLVLLIAFWIASNVSFRLICRVESRFASRRELLELAGRTVKISLLVIGFVVALGTAGVNVSAMVAGLGLSGFALGFALRDILSNILAGFLILFYSPFNTGDHISVTGLEGRVTGIDLRYTSLDAGDRVVLIPNSNLFTNPITVRAAGGAVK